MIEEPALRPPPLLLPFVGKAAEDWQVRRAIVAGLASIGIDAQFHARAVWEQRVVRPSSKLPSEAVTGPLTRQRVLRPRAAELPREAMRRVQHAGTAQAAGGASHWARWRRRQPLPNAEVRRSPRPGWRLHRQGVRLSRGTRAIFLRRRGEVSSDSCQYGASRDTILACDFRSERDLGLWRRI